MEKKMVGPVVDTQLVEIMGRNWLTNELLNAGLEVARPERDRGVDLICYADENESAKFMGFPIQLKAATDKVFSIDPNYSKFPDLKLVYIWNLGDNEKTDRFALSYDQAILVADRMGYTKTDSWKTGGRNKK